MLVYTNRQNRSGLLLDVITAAGVFIGVSKGNLVTTENVKSMTTATIILAMANPIPEITPDVGRAAGAAVVGTGRSDFIKPGQQFVGVF